MPPKTMFEKIWDSHVVHEEVGQPTVLYVDLHLVHEVTSPQAFDGLRMSGRRVRRTDLTVATADHNTPHLGSVPAHHRPHRTTAVGCAQPQLRRVRHHAV